MNGNSSELSSSLLPAGGTPDQWLAALDMADGTEARDSFHLFLNLSFTTIEKNPDKSFEDAWYYPVICEHAQAVARGQLKRLVVVQPPNTFKSGIWSVALPAWDWLKNPGRRYIVNSNEKTLVTELAERCRDLITSSWYQRTFQPQWRIRSGQNAKQFFANTVGGARRGVSTGSAITGKKAHIIVSDDLHDAVNVVSPVVRKSDKDWFNQGLSDRLIHEREGAIVVVGHRVEPDDIQNEKTEDGWPVLHLPEQFTERLRKTYPVTIGGITSDTRAEGEFLRPHRIAEAEKESIIRERGIGYWDTKNQGEPKTREGSRFPSDRVRTIGVVPVGMHGVLFWDTAATTLETSSATAGVVVGRSPDGRFAIVRAKWFKARPSERNTQMMNFAYEVRRIAGFTLDRIVIEHPGGSGGVEVGELWVKQYAGWAIEVQPTSGRGSKEARSEPLSAQWEGGNVDIVDGDWNRSYLDIMEQSHNRTEKDLMDATAGGFNKVAMKGTPGDAYTGEGDVNKDYGQGTWMNPGHTVNENW